VRECDWCAELLGLELERRPVLHLERLGKQGACVVRVTAEHCWFEAQGLIQGRRRHELQKLLSTASG
jgi:hypothetical protein